MKMFKFFISKLLLISMILYFLFFGSFTVFSSDITDAKWQFNIVIANSGSATTQVATIFSLNTASLINQGFCNSSANDTTIISAGTDVVFMPGYNTSNPWVIYITSIGASSSKTEYLYTKGATGGHIAYFPGASGMTVNNSTTLDINNSGNYTFDILFDPTSTGWLFNNPNVSSAKGNGNGTITFTANSTTGSYYPVINATTNGTGSGTNVATSFATGHALNDMNMVIITFYNTSPSTSVTPPSGWTQIYLQGLYDSSKYLGNGAWYKVDSGSEPSSANFTLSVSSSFSYISINVDEGTYTGTPVSGTPAWATSGTPNPPSLTSGWGVFKTKWLAVVGCINSQSTYSTGFNLVDNAGTTNYYSYISQKDETVASKDPGAWSTSTYWVSNTVAIKGSLAYLTTGVITGEEHVIQIYLSDGYIGIKIDNGSAITKSFSDNISAGSSPFQFLTNNICKYCNYIKILKSGSLTGYWYWEYSTNFTDHSGNNNTATPTFRTSSSNANVSATIISFSPTSLAVASQPETEYTQVLSDLDAPPQMYVEGDYEHVPGADIINAILDKSEVPRALWWFPFIFIGIGILGMLVFDATKTQGGEGSLLTQCIVCDALLFFFAIMGPIMLWPGILFWVPAGALIISRKHYGWG